ncbi:rhodanese-like domain-containing protein [Gammaproteobacteria bacterium]|nr:rhodanese-like domain-containing protein [Gammaproteobacteria bacterium]
MLEFFSFLYEQWFLSIPLVIFIGLFFSSLSKKGGKKISTHELINLNNQGLARLVDIRKSDEFNAGHIAGAINIPFADFEKRHYELLNKKDLSIILVCEMGNQSGNAGEILQKSGFKNSFILSGGISEWRHNSLPLV